MSDFIPCQSFNCIVELDEPAYKEAFASGKRRLFSLKRFQMSDLRHEFLIAFNSEEAEDSAKKFSISITNISKSELQIVSFNGSRVIGGSLLVLPGKENSSSILMF
jgi:hypothetical protein